MKEFIKFTLAAALGVLLVDIILKMIRKNKIKSAAAKAATTTATTTTAGM